jgi:hypothetical protein
LPQISKSRRTFNVILLTFPVLLSQAGCRKSIEPAIPAKLTPMSKPERIAQVQRILKHIVVPSEIQDAHFDEVEIGDGKGLGPTDYISYMYLKVDPAAIDKWTALLKMELGYSPRHQAPAANYPWWVNAERFKLLQFFEPKPLSSRNGWVGISRETGEIWIQDFTT